jgi:hypothetical protein
MQPMSTGLWTRIGTNALRIVFAAALLAAGGIFLGASPASASTQITIVDGLAGATPGMQFSIFSGGGASILSFQFIGPEFTLAQPTVLTEIGGFVDLFPGSTGPVSVQIRPATNGLPDPSTVLASFVLSDDNDPLVVSYESVAPDLTLQPGTYFALFNLPGTSEGFILNSAAGYQAGLVDLGVLDPNTGIGSVSQQYAAVRILGELAVQNVPIDVRPGGYPNSINIKSLGVIPVAILSSDTFDARTVDKSTVRFGATGTEAAPVKSLVTDVNADGMPDLLLYFKVQASGFACGNTSASLTGQTFSGQAIQGTDSVKIVGCQ